MAETADLQHGDVLAVRAANLMDGYRELLNVNRMLRGIECGDTYPASATCSSRPKLGCLPMRQTSKPLITIRPLAACVVT
jgi:hypothetical protein